jgi:hypothetical protein
MDYPLTAKMLAPTMMVGMNSDASQIAAERYTREADRRRGGRRAIVKLEDHKANRIPPNLFC